MANILITGNQEWVIDLCKKGLAGEGHNISATDDIDSVKKNVLSFRPNIVFLNQYLKHGALVWDVLDDIKAQDPILPVLIVATHDNFLSGPRFSKADGCLIRSHTAAYEFRQKVSALLTT